MQYEFPSELPFRYNTVCQIVKIIEKRGMTRTSQILPACTEWMRPKFDALSQFMKVNMAQRRPLPAQFPEERQFDLFKQHYLYSGNCDCIWENVIWILRTVAAKNQLDCQWIARMWEILLLISSGQQLIWFIWGRARLTGSTMAPWSWVVCKTYTFLLHRCRRGLARVVRTNNWNKKHFLSP